jgi:hypothetical protein
MLAEQSPSDRNASRAVAKQIEDGSFTKFVGFRRIAIAGLELPQEFQYLGRRIRANSPSEFVEQFRARRTISGLSLSSALSSAGIAASPRSQSACWAFSRVA